MFGQKANLEQSSESPQTLSLKEERDRRLDRAKVMIFVIEIIACV